MKRRAPTNKRGVGAAQAEQVRPFVSALGENTTVQRLDLRGNALGNSGVRAVAKALRNNDAIQEADLRDNGPLSSGTALSVYFSMGDRNRRCKLGMLSFDSIVEDAVERCAKQFGIAKDAALAIASADPVMAGLRAMCEDLQSRHFQPAEFARHEELAQRTANRIKFLQYLEAHPEIEEQPLKNPVVIMGLWRTGTTKLFNLMARCTGARSPQLWEIWYPTPPPTRDNYKNDPRIEKARKRCDDMFAIGIMNRSIHDMDAVFPEECMFIMRECHYCLEYLFNQTYPNYLRWLASQDMRDAYRTCRQFYQLLGSKYQPDNHWLLKAPLHLSFMDLMLEEYGQDTKMIFCHRDPVATVGSTLSLYIGIAHSEWDDADRHHNASRFLLNYCIEAWRKAMKKLDEMEAEGRGSQICHVYYNDVMRDPIGTIRAASRELQLPEFDEQPLKDWLEANPKGKHGAHRYTLEQFGVTKADVYRGFAPYYARFFPDVKIELSKL
eukprot:TRINITY_DN2782_c0_g1_i1.p1 TRINITY_DN2782_c0_g1~~TRINITY_DN2782_c0_g1_i1.p1  ORF type:complete len:495 (-),score=146.60 TRINITY_DN2782_c0_g1_i1:414-1898(-)